MRLRRPSVAAPAPAPALALAAAIAVAATGCTASAGSEPGDGADRATAVVSRSIPVVGYAEAGSTTSAQLDASRAALTTVGIDGINVTADGAHVTPVSADAFALVKKAHNRGQKAELLVGNFDAVLGDFSPAIGDALLGSDAHIDAVVKALADEVAKHRWDGVTVDLESLTNSHPAGLTRLLSRLNSTLGSGKSVSVCLMATTEGYESLGYDLAAIGKAADHVVLMAYDQHGPTWTGAGPVGGTPWVKRSLAPLVAAIPRAKIQLGVAGYGYTWPKKGQGAHVSDAAARAAVKHARVTAAWSPTQEEWHATLANGAEMWWSDGKTYRARLAYAKRLRLGGVAVWSLGLSDPLTP